MDVINSMITVYNSVIGYTAAMLLGQTICLDDANSKSTVAKLIASIIQG